MRETLKEKAVKGIVWNLAERFGLQGMRLFLGIVLARLLAPEDFGLIGMITVFFALAQVFVEGGFSKAYIQKEHITEVDADTVFYTNLVVSVVLYGALWNAAPLIAGFYEQPSLIHLVRVMGLVVVINAFNIIQVAKLTRVVNFRRKAQVALIASLVAGLVGVAAAIYGLGVWSLVARSMCNRFLVTTGLWFSSKWKPSWQFSKESFMGMFSFGSWLLGAGIVRTVFENVYILTIGKFFPAAQLGFYTKSMQFQKMASQELAQAVGTVAFPVFSQLQDDRVRLQNGMRKFLKHTLVFTMPLLVMLMVVAKPFVILLLTEKWAPMIPYLQLLCVVGLLYPIHAVNVQVLLAQGRSNLNFRLEILKGGLRVMNIAIMYRWGVFYIIVGEVFVSFAALLLNTYYTRKLIDYGLLKQLKDIKEIVIGSAIAGAIGYAISSSADNLWFVFFLGGISTFSAYIALQYFTNKIFLREVLSLKNSWLVKNV